MGRTLLPYSMQIDMVLARFKEYRRGLRKADQEIFDQLIRYARKQLQAGTMASHPNPFDAMSMTMLLELQKQSIENEERLRRLELDFESLLESVSMLEAPTDPPSPRIPEPDE